MSGCHSVDIFRFSFGFHFQRCTYMIALKVERPGVHIFDLAVFYFFSFILKLSLAPDCKKTFYLTSDDKH